MHSINLARLSTSPQVDVSMTLQFVPGQNIIINFFIFIINLLYEQREGSS